MKKIGYILLVVVFILIINGLISSIFDLWQKQSLLISAQKELDFQKIKNSKLKAELTYTQTQNFIDETARNKLFLAKQGEKEILIPNNLIEASKKNTPYNNSNWQKWLDLFYLRH